MMEAGAITPPENLFGQKAIAVSLWGNDFNDALCIIGFSIAFMCWMQTGAATAG